MGRHADGLFRALLESVVLAVAYFGPDGELEYANPQFHSLWSALSADDHAGCCDQIGRVAAFLGLPLAPTDFIDFTSSTGRVVAFAISRPDLGGWILSAQDVTELRRSAWETQRAQKVALIALADLAEHRDTETGEHFLRVARMTYEVARSLHKHGHYPDILTPDFLSHIGVSSILHDVGKVSVPDAILYKPDLLTADERAIMAQHAVNGGNILRKAETMLEGSIHFRLAAEIAEYHHERWNGNGYPHGLSGLDIPLSARIVAATDVYDALITERPYKQAWSPAQTLSHMQNHAGTDFDPLVIASLTEVLDARNQANTVVWTAEMSVGIAILDHDHRVLIALINQIALPENKCDPLAVDFVLDELMGYTAQHFRREEAIFAQTGYPDADHHRQIHQAMIQHIADMHRRCMAAFTPAIGDELHHFLAGWLTTHIMIEDKGYVPFVEK